MPHHLYCPFVTSLLGLSAFHRRAFPTWPWCSHSTDMTLFLNSVASDATFLLDCIANSLLTCPPCLWASLVTGAPLLNGEPGKGGGGWYAGDLDG
jgi:hypothetical protein